MNHIPTKSRFLSLMTENAFASRSPNLGTFATQLTQEELAKLLVLSSDDNSLLYHAFAKICDYKQFATIVRHVIAKEDYASGKVLAGINQHLDNEDPAIYRYFLEEIVLGGQGADDAVITTATTEILRLLAERTDYREVREVVNTFYTRDRRAGNVHSEILSELYDDLPLFWRYRSPSLPE